MEKNNAINDYLKDVEISSLYFLISFPLSILFFLILLRFIYAPILRQLGEVAIVFLPFLSAIWIIILILSVIGGSYFGARLMVRKFCISNAYLVSGLATFFFAAVIAVSYLGVVMNAAQFGAFFGNTYEFTKPIDYRLDKAYSISGIGNIVGLLRDYALGKYYEFKYSDIKIIAIVVFVDVAMLVAYFFVGLRQTKKMVLGCDTGHGFRYFLYFILIICLAFLSYTFGVVLNNDYTWVGIHYAGDNPAGLFHSFYKDQQQCQQWVNKEVQRPIYGGGEYYNCEGLLKIGK